MLLLSRKLGQSVVIGDQITLTVGRIAGNRVASDFDAECVTIPRNELSTFIIELYETNASPSQGNSNNRVVP